MGGGTLSNSLSDIKKDILFQQAAYKEYLSSIHFFDNATVLFVDPSYKGTTQNKLHQFTKKHIQGFYCYADLSESNLNNTGNMKAFFQDSDDKTGKKCFLQKWNSIFESSIMVAPTGTFIKINQTNGEFIYSPLGQTQLEFQNKEDTYEGIQQYFEDFMKLQKKFSFDLKPDKKLPLVLFEKVVEKNILGDKVKKSLFMDDFYDVIRDLPVF